REANETMVKNITSTMNLIYAIKDTVPEAHILKLGTMGEYGTPNIDIPEGFFEIEYHGRKDTLPFPKNASSWYHWTKVHDSNNLMFANRVWDLAVTDVMQGVVYGTRTQEIADTGLFTRFDIDEVYGTALNRFTAEAIIDVPLTVYGKGGQTRGFLSLNDSIQCLTLALEKPADHGEYRVLNQFDEKYSVEQLAEMVQRIFERDYGKIPEIAHVDNPRVEKEDHYYNPEHRKLELLGYRRTKNIEDEIRDAISDLSRFRSRLIDLKDTLMPKTFWKKSAYDYT
ncbi:NAD-dependent epimerase/dehydratase family protein, partial [Thermoplasma sp.]|uniref:NAD-dependent epimerase/dehydratase family protein n=1 Tax=Thermoplasma sp. TaxID=1973142 RepID=UPI001282475D